MSMSNMGIVRLSIVVLFAVLSPASSSAIFGGQSPESLYKSNDNVIILTTANFTNFVVNEHQNGSKLQFIQFYSSWCGHCQAFAPFFKDFLKTSLNWRDAIDVAVIDCAREENQKVCQDYNIMAYPTLKMFKFAPTADYLGDELSVNKRSIKEFREAIIKWIQDNAKTLQFPETFPHLDVLTASDKENLIHKLEQTYHNHGDNSQHNSNSTKTLIFVEKDSSFLGRELALDFYSVRKEINFFRMVESDIRLLEQILPKPLDTFSLPFMLHFENGKFNIVLKPIVSTDDDYEYYSYLIRKQFLKDDSLYPLRNELEKKKDNLKIEVMKYSDRIYQTDLNNALRYLLYNEVQKFKTLKINDANALNQLLMVIHDYFPFGNTQTKEYINALKAWFASEISEKNQNSGVIKTEDLLEKMKELEKEYYFPLMKNWKACSDISGSGKVRSYPCSLWTMFHVLTVNEYRQKMISKQWQQLHQTVYAMRDYIRTFFGCKECSNHFYSMAKDLESQIPYTNSSVLWLWEAHNRVNARLKDTDSEIKQLPKRQFPTYEECQKCYKNPPNKQHFKNFDEYRQYFNDNELFEFLLFFYDSSRIIPDPDDARDREEKVITVGEIVEKVKPEPPLSRPSSFEALQTKPERQLKSFTPFSNLDYSMVILLYIVSIGLLVTLWGFISFRKSKNRRSTSFLPL